MGKMWWLVAGVTVWWLFSRKSAPSKRQTNHGEQTSSSSRNQSECHPTITKSSFVSNRETTDKSCVPLELSGNGVGKSRTNSTISRSSGKSSDTAFQFPLPPSVHSQQLPSAAVKPTTASSIPKERNEIQQKSKSLQASSLSGYNPRANDSTRGIISSKSPSTCNVSSAASEPLYSSSRSPLFAHSSASSSETERPKSSLESSASTFSEKSPPPKPPPLSVKPTLSLAPSSSLSHQEKAKYIWVENASSTYVFPDDIKSLIERDIVPEVLKMPLSKSSYKDYFHALLYAEDCYLEKWDGFEMENVTVELHEAAIYTRRGKDKELNMDAEKDEKTFVAFEMDKIPDRRPFLLSRDFVSLQPSNRKSKTFQGVIYRVVKSNLVLAEFGESFYSQHHHDSIYDVKFSFNRVCLKRAHQAIAAASHTLFKNFLFPNIAPKHELTEHFMGSNDFAVCEIFKLQGAFPYLVEGPMSVIQKMSLSITGSVIVEAIVRICRAEPSKRILLCAPTNKTCDLLMRGLKKELAESDMFRANAAFREMDGVPSDILPSCLYEPEMDCFSCPPLGELKKYKVILSTFMSSFRLYGEGIAAGHFSHIFLVDASSATEPETMIPLTNFANDRTIVVVTGAARNRPGWVRSKIARQNGLEISYFERLGKSDLYKKPDTKILKGMENSKQGTYC